MQPYLRPTLIEQCISCGARICNEICKLTKVVVKLWNQTCFRWKCVVWDKSFTVGSCHQGLEHEWQLLMLEGLLNNVRAPCVNLLPLMIASNIGSSSVNLINIHVWSWNPHYLIKCWISIKTIYHLMIPIVVFQ